MSHIRHDAYFREVFSDPVQAAELIQFCLPKQEADLLDLNQLVKIPDDYFTPEGEQGRCDLLLKCPLKGKDQDLLIAILVEHKSYPDQEAIAQMARYWTGLLLKPKPMPVIPILFYHGKENFRPIPFSEMFEWLPEPLRKYQPDFRFLYIDLNKKEPEEIFNHPALSSFSRVGLLVLQAVFAGDEKMEQTVTSIAERLLQRDKEDQRRFFQRLMIYLWGNSEATLSKFRDFMDYLPEAERPEMMTPAKQAVAEGHAKGFALGREEGREEERLDNARKMKSEGLHPELIVRITGLSASEIETLG